MAAVNPTGRPDGLSGPNLFDDQLVGPLAEWRGMLVEGRPVGSTPATTLGDRETFSGLIDRFQTTRGGRDRLAATSLWTQIYFRALIVPAVVATLGREQGLPLGLHDIHIAFCPDSGVPLRFGMQPNVRATHDAPLFEPLIEGHLAPFVAIVRRQSGLSSRLLWENAGWYLVWILGGMGRRRPACLPLVLGLLEDRAWPAGRFGSDRGDEAGDTRGPTGHAPRVLPPLPRPGLSPL